METCPKCGNYSVVYDEYYKRKMCLMLDCCWSELSEDKIVIKKIDDMKNKKDDFIIMPEDNKGIGTVIFCNRFE